MNPAAIWWWYSLAEASLSPLDGRYNMAEEQTFGGSWVLYVSDFNGLRWLLVDSDLAVSRH